MKQKKIFRVDFHLHLYTSWKDTFYEAGPRDLKILTEQFSKRGLDAATITSFNDNRFDRLMETSKDLPCDWSVKHSDMGAIVTMSNGESFYWFNSDEKPTREGHFLIVGNKRESPHIKPYRNLEETLEEAKQHSIMLIADHPLMLLSDTRSSGMGRENLKRFRSYFSAGELNGNARPPLFYGVNKDTLKLCNELKLPIVANSDAYGILAPLISLPFFLIFSNIGKTYTEFKRELLDLPSVDSLVNSFKSEIEANENCKPVLRNNIGNNLTSIVGHIAFGLFYRFFRGNKFLKIKHHGDRFD